METLNDYLDAARARLNVSSYNKLAIRMGFNPVDVHRWRQGKSLPADQNMVTIADTAGQDPELALMHLNSWRAKEPARGHYRNLIRRLSLTAALVLLLAAGPLPAVVAAAPAGPATDREHSDARVTATIHYANRFRRRVRRWVSRITEILSIIPYGLRRDPVVAQGLRP